MFKFLLWLLVPLLPIVGLLVGAWLIPERKPRWHTNYDNLISVLGHADNGQTLLVGEVTSQGDQFLFGLDVETGKERFRIALTRELLDAKITQLRQTRLSDDGRYVIFPAEHSTIDNQKQIILFDWKEKQVVKRFLISNKGLIQSVYLRGKVLAASISGYGVALWNSSAPDTPFGAVLDTRMAEFGLSPDASIVYYRHYQFVAGTFQIRLAFYDVKHDTILPVIQADLFDVCWSPDSQSFTAIGNDPARGGFVKRLYIRSREGFTAVPDKDHLFQLPGNVLADQHFCAIATTARHDPWRMKIATFFGSGFGALLDRLWPDSQILCFFDRTSTSLLHKLSLPLGSKAITSLKINSHPQGQGVALWDERWIRYWDLNSTSGWYPLLGLITSLLLATLLVWRLLKHRPRMVNTPSARSGMASARQ